MLAAAVTRAQGIEVVALFFETPFFTSQRARLSARSMDLPFKVVDITERHLEVVKHPPHGYGGNMNPCIDCHGLMFRIAGELLEEEEAHFVITGEVMGQRPMSQNKQSLSRVASLSGIERLLLRPLSAKLLPVTAPEEHGWVDRELLLDFQGRSRKPQMELARNLDITEYPSPAGGCLLTEKVFSQRLKILLAVTEHPERREIELLKVGRHFRLDSDARLVVGRNRKENETIAALAGKDDTLLTSVSIPGPTSLLMGTPTEAGLNIAAAVTVAYGDAQGHDACDVRITAGGAHRIVSQEVQDKAEFRRFLG